ncbi:DinB family protein [Flavobacterium sp. LS1R49]|uniref:DinB family protein n=1 Tax=Flavobacterium shii TaxID=2987687 RepID=A0A9X2ZGJ2_9FLAO|nr:DinB family protein [Flavobacterium shii]MCV9928202.1 DinB family protein [Flavobacterium shii]
MAHLETLKALFKRDLTKLKLEIESYQNEAIIWSTNNQITNSAGNLCLHLIGNLNTYIGATLGNSGYIRHRELEFSLKNIPKTELITKIEETIVVVDTALSNLSEAELELEFPIIIFKGKDSTGFILTHLTTHLAYHLGQINYHRRLLDDISIVNG